MRHELKSIRIWSFTKVSFFVNLVVGFVLGLMYAMMLPILVAGMSHFGGFYGRSLDPLGMPIGVMLVIMPIMGAMFAAVFHTLIGIVLVAVYNLVARLIGGLEMRFEPTETKPVSQVARPITAYTMPHHAPLTMKPRDDSTRVAATPPPPPPVSGVSMAPVPPDETVSPPRPTTEPGQSTDESGGEDRPSTTDGSRE